MTAVDKDALFAGLDLVERTGATEIEIGYLHDDVPVEKAEWWATARYRGARITVEAQRGPVAAVEVLARRLLTGGQCRHCRRLVTLDDAGAWAHDVTLVDGRRWTAQEQAAAGLCRWRRLGARWVRGCEIDPPDQAGPVPDRAARRRAARRNR